MVQSVGVKRTCDFVGGKAEEDDTVQFRVCDVELGAWSLALQASGSGLGSWSLELGALSLVLSISLSFSLVADSDPWPRCEEMSSGSGARVQSQTPDATE